MTRVHSFVLLTAMLAGPIMLVHAQPDGYTPSKADSDAYRNRPCADPWINIVHLYLESKPITPPGAGVVGACDKMRYKQGNWSSFQELRNHVRALHALKQAQRLTEVMLQSPRGPRLALYRAGELIAAPLVGDGGGTLVLDEYARLIGKGGAGIVAAGGGNLIGDGGGTAQPRQILSVGGSYSVPLAPGIIIDMRRP